MVNRLRKNCRLVPARCYRFRLSRGSFRLRPYRRGSSERWLTLERWAQHAFSSINMKLSRTIAYALHATMRLACDNSSVPIPCSRLAQEGRLPERFLLQVLRSLVNAGVLRSTRGVEGGYCLARPAKQITLLQIIDAFESPLESSLPPTTDISIEARTRILATLRQASHAARDELHKLTVADLLPIPNSTETEIHEFRHPHEFGD